jgi:hypothetical protein
MHIDHLVDAFDLYVAGKYDDAYEQARTAYMHMFPTGAYLAKGIAAQFPDVFHTAAENDVMKVWFKIQSNVLIIDGKESKMDTMPFNRNGTSYIPLRYLAEAIGAKVTWDNEARSVWIDAGEAKAQFWIGQPFMELNGKRMEIGQPVILQDDRTQVPVRFVAELFGWDVAWGTSDWSITLTKKTDAEKEAMNDMHNMHH